MENRSSDVRTEREQRQLCQFEALLTERDANDGNIEYNARNRIAECQFETAEDQPDDIGDGVFAEIGFDDGAKGPKRQTCQFERLQAKRNTDDGDAPQKAEQKPGNGAAEANKDEPNDVADRFHNSNLLLLIKGTYSIYTFCRHLSIAQRKKLCNGLDKPRGIRYNKQRRRRSLVVKPQLPKLEMRVRFPSPAPTAKGLPHGVPFPLRRQYPPQAKYPSHFSFTLPKPIDGTLWVWYNEGSGKTPRRRRYGPFDQTDKTHRRGG